MAQIRRRAIGGKVGPMTYDPEVHEPEWTIEDLERDRLREEVRTSPAILTIYRYAEMARDLGLDLDDLAEMRRVVAAAEKAHAREVQHDQERATFRALRHVRSSDVKHPCIVYYMRMSGLVKIGLTTSIRQRYVNLHPEEILAVEPGADAVEMARHTQFAHLRSHGEWFRAGPDLLEHIAWVRERFVGEVGKPLNDWLRSVGVPIRRVSRYDLQIAE